MCGVSWLATKYLYPTIKAGASCVLLSCVVHVYSISVRMLASRVGLDWHAG